MTDGVTGPTGSITGPTGIDPVCLYGSLFVCSPSLDAICSISLVPFRSLQSISWIHFARVTQFHCIQQMILLVI
jgi:hypothetical protein